MGVFPLSTALTMARERNLDLIMITEKVTPPICKLGEYGKYLYALKKKERKNIAGSKHSETKNIRLTFNISDNDINTRAMAAEKFLNKGDKVNVDLRLRGREKQLSDVGIQKVNKFMETLKAKMEIKIDRELKKEPRGLSMIISKK